MFPLCPLCLLCALCVPSSANLCKEEGTLKTILFNLCGHGNFDMKAYDDYFAGKLEKHDLSQAEIDGLIAKIDTPEIA